MSDTDIEEAIKQAKMYESQDQVTKENLLLKNEVETLIINVQNGLATHKKEMDKNDQRMPKRSAAHGYINRMWIF